MVQRPDPSSEEHRWLIVGLVDNVVIVVSYTSPELETGYQAEVGRIISVRKATAHESKAYEEEGC